MYKILCIYINSTTNKNSQLNFVLHHSELMLLIQFNIKRAYRLNFGIKYTISK